MGLLCTCGNAPARLHAVFDRLDAEREQAVAAAFAERDSCRSAREDTSTSTADAAAAHARLLADDETHPLDCRCHDCAVDELSAEDYR